MGVLRIVRAGACTTVQDLGRPGQARFGVSPSGPMDPLAHRLANHLVGNPAGAATLEVTGAGLEIEIGAELAIGVAGADLESTLSGTGLGPVGVGIAAPGARLSFPRRRQGARAYVAVAGGLDVPLVLGSAATDLGASLGGVEGRPLRSGDVLAVKPGGRALPQASRDEVARLTAAVLPFLSLPVASPSVLRVVLEGDPLVAEAQALLESRIFRLSSRSGRTGFRFEGEPLPAPSDAARLSEPTAPGAIQLPPDGLPILLMADRNPTGGYPRIGHLCRADRPLAAQLWPGDGVRFQSIGLEEAVALARDRERAFSAALASFRP